jgi:GrpB-like predicted nucleotidyltransferase (UPF0157 family)
MDETRQCAGRPEGVMGSWPATDREFPLRPQGAVARQAQPLRLSSPEPEALAMTAHDLRVVLEGWLAIAVILLLVRWLTHLQERWEYRQHKRNLGRIPPRKAL